MSTLTIRLPDTKHQRLKAFARTRGVSLNKLVEEWATVALAQLDTENRYRLRAALAQLDTENRYRLRAARGRPETGLALLDKLDRSRPRRAARKKAKS
jgi:HicB family